MEERNFNEVLEKIKSLGNKRLNDKLKSLPQRGGKLQWKRLQTYVHNNVEKNSNDETVVKIYAILYDCSEKQVEEQFRREGL